MTTATKKPKRAAKTGTRSVKKAPKRRKADAPIREFNELERESMRTLLRAYYNYERERIRLDSRLEQKKDGTAKKNARLRDDAMLLLLIERRKEVAQMTKEIEKEIKSKVEATALWQHFLKNVKGCGVLIAAVIMTEFDIRIATTVSKMWAFSGMATGKVNGWKWVRGEWRETDTLIPRDRLTSGFRSPFNQFLRSTLIGVLGAQFLISNSPYRKHYDDTRHRLESMEWGTPSKNPTDKENPRAGHQHRAAMRKMVKEFLKDLYVAWRTLEGLPVREPYAEEYLGKVHDDGTDVDEEPKSVKRATAKKKSKRKK